MYRSLNWIALLLVIAGGINWGLIGLFEFNLINVLFGALPWFERVIYTLVGLAAGYMVYYAVKVEASDEARTRTRPRTA